MNCCMVCLMTKNKENETFLDIAEEIGDQICKKAFWNESRCNWIGKSLEGESSLEDPLPLINKALGLDLYDGTSGVALFLGHLYSTTHKDYYYEVSYGAITHALHHVSDISGDNRFGFFSGSIGIAYCAFKLSSLLRNDDLLGRATSLLKTLISKRKEPHLRDVISGSAGAIPALLEMNSVIGDQAILDYSVDLGSDLIAIAIPERLGWSWDSRANGIGSVTHNLTGFAHGAAGIGYGLLELFNVTEKNEFLQAAENAFAYENSWYNPTRKNWPDFRELSNPADPPYEVAWCHGAVGIGISRLRAYQLRRNKQYLDDSLAALDTATKIARDRLKNEPNFSLCHGMSGFIDFFLYAHQVLLDESYMNLAIAIAMDGLNRHGGKTHGWPCGIPTGETPGLMLGLSGIGYTYLRMTKHGRVPSILLLPT